MKLFNKNSKLTNLISLISRTWLLVGAPRRQILVTFKPDIVDQRIRIVDLELLGFLNRISNVVQASLVIDFSGDLQKNLAN